MKIEDRSRILKAIARGRTWLQELLSGQIAGTEEIAVRERCSERLIRVTLSLAFLSPKRSTRRFRSEFTAALYCRALRRA